MKKTLMLFASLALVATHAFALYIVVLKDGTQYKAKAKWTIVNGKALVILENGQTLSIDPTLIDAARSEQTTKLGLGNVNIVDLDPHNVAQQKQHQSSLGDQIRLHQPVNHDATPAAAAPAPPPVGANALGTDILDKFARAYENVGIFEQKLTPTGAHSLRADLTADSEDKVFNAISATAFLIVRNAGVSGAQIDKVDLFMKTTTGGSSGRFEMNREDATAIDTQKIKKEDYFVHKVIY